MPSLPARLAHFTPGRPDIPLIKKGGIHLWLARWRLDHTLAGIALGGYTGERIGVLGLKRGVLATAAIK
jgi:hypothetical protein